MDSGSISTFRNFVAVANMRRMVTVGPRHPMRPIGPPQVMSEDVGGAGIRYQPYRDGWIYELFSPVGAVRSVIPRAKTVDVLLAGRWITAYEDGGVNFLAVWLDKQTHEAVFPAGPPAYRYYDEAAGEAATSGIHRWMKDPNETLPDIPDVRNLAARAGLSEDR